MRITSTLLPFLIAAMMGLSLALSCHAQDFVAQHSKDGADELFSWVASYGLSFGGPDAVTNQYNPYEDRFEITGLASLSAGGDYQLKHSPLSIQALVAVHFDNAEANKGDANFDYHTFDVLGFYNLGHHRFGVGITHHLNPTFNAKTSRGNQMTHFEDTLGSMVEYNYLYDKKTAVGLRFTEIKYRSLTNNQRETIDGQNLSLFIKTFF